MLPSPSKHLQKFLTVLGIGSSTEAGRPRWTMRTYIDALEAPGGGDAEHVAAADAGHTVIDLVRSVVAAQPRASAAAHTDKTARAVERAERTRALQARLREQFDEVSQRSLSRADRRRGQRRYRLEGVS